MWEAPTVWLGPRPMIVRRCPTLPHPPGCSTIGAVGLSFRVRDGTGRFPHAMTAVTLCPVPPAMAGGGKSCGYNMAAAVMQLWCCYSVGWFLATLPSGDGFVGWEPHSGRKQSCFFVPPGGGKRF